MSLFENILGKLTIKEIGIHLQNYFELYTKPLKVWRKVINSKTDGYNFIILHLVYYCFFLYFIAKDITLVIPIAIFEVIITFIPFIFFLPPFLFFIKIYKRQSSWHKLFRLFLIIKFQFIPIFILIYLGATATKVENLYIISENLIWTIWVAFIFIFPLLLNIVLWKKAIWALTNYIFFLLGLSLLTFLVTKIDENDKIVNKLSLESPNSEYTNFKLKGLYSPLLFDDTSYFVVIKVSNDSDAVILRTQFVSFDLKSSYFQSRINQLSDKMESINSVSARKMEDISKVNKKESNTQDISDEELTLPLLDSLRKQLNFEFYTLLKETRKMKDSSKFESNRDYFHALTAYLEAYEKSYLDTSQINSIMTTASVNGTIKLGNEKYGVLLNLDSNYYRPSKKKLADIESVLERRTKRATIIPTILLFPLEILLDKIGYFD